MSMPSLSWAVQTGVMVARASEVSRQRLPAMEPESSIRKTVSKLERKAYGSSAVGATAAVKVVVGDRGAAFGAAV